MVDLGIGEPRLPLGEDLVVGHVHARGAADIEGSSLSPRIKRRIRAKTSLAEIERKERGRTNIPGPPRLRTLVTDAAEVPISEGSLVPASTPTSGPQRAHPYTPVGDAVGSSSFEMVPPVRARAASDRGFDDSADTIPIARANSSPSIIQVPTQLGSSSKDWQLAASYSSGQYGFGVSLSYNRRPLDGPHTPCLITAPKTARNVEETIHISDPSNLLPLMILSHDGNLRYRRSGGFTPSVPGHCLGRAELCKSVWNARAPQALNHLH